MKVYELGEGGRDASSPLPGVSRRQPPPRLHPRGKCGQRSAGRGLAGRPLPSLSGPSRRPPGARSVLHRQGAGAASRRRGPIGRGGEAGRRPSGELASSRPLAGVRGSRRSPGESGGGRGRRRRRVPSASGRTDRSEAGRQARGR